MGSVTSSCASVNGFCLFLCFCWRQLILLSARLGNLLLSPALIPHPAELIACFISNHVSGLHLPVTLLIASWGAEVFGRWQQAMWYGSHRDCLSAGLCGWPAATLGIQHEMELPAGWEGNTHWSTSASHHLVTIDRGTWDRYPALKGYSNKNLLVPVSPLTQSEKRGTQQSVSLTVERVFSGRVCELCVWETLSCLFFFPSSQRSNYLLDNVAQHLHCFLLWYLARGFGLKLM